MYFVFFLLFFRQMDAWKVSFLNYFLILQKGSLMWSMLKLIQKFAPAPPTGLYSHVAQVVDSADLSLFRVN